MSDDSDPGNPFEGLPLFGDLAKLFQGGDPWQSARQFAISLATDGESEPNVDPIVRQRYAELSRIAELHVAKATGLTVTRSGQPVTVVPVTRGEWAVRALEAYRPLLELLGSRLSAPPIDTDEPSDDPMMQLFAGLMKMINPSMLAMSTGSMVGNLTRRSLGAYELPIPRPEETEIPIVEPNVADFGSQWGVTDDDLALWICLHELTFHTVLGIGHVGGAVTDLMTEYIGGFQAGSGNQLEEQLGSFDPGSDLESLQSQLQETFGSPEVLLGAIRSPEQEAMLPRLSALVAVLIGYVDHILDISGSGLVGSYGALSEALRRRRVTMAAEDRFVERLLGLELGRETVERGHAFIEGVVERDGDVNRLWTSHESLPTPSEVDAPGLWLARLEFI